MERLVPKVTGLSPMTGMPGTKITIRGENLGESNEDIIGLTINGYDCWPYLEWKSPKKIITRCVKSLGSGDVIITTKSGGIGTCEVQFNCYEGNISPTEESAVWINEISFSIPEQESLGTIMGNKEEYSIDISSTRFKPDLYLVQNYASSDLNDLFKIYNNLQSELKSKSDPEQMSTTSNRAALLKSNLSTIMECLQILEHLSRIVAISKDNLIDDSIDSIKQSLAQTHEIFDPLLEQRELVQSMESAMQVFKQNETLFNLPAAIEKSIRDKNYDSVIKEISGVTSRLQAIGIDQGLSEKIQQDVTGKIEKLRTVMEQELHHLCKCDESERNIDYLKKLINHLNRLSNSADYDIWTAVGEMRDSLKQNLSNNYDHFLELTLKDDENSQEPPYVVQFVQLALKIFHETYYDIIALGESYFDPKDEFACRESAELRHQRLLEFEENMICKPISDLTYSLRLSLVPDSPKLQNHSTSDAEDETQSNQTKKPVWPPNETSAYVSWIKHVLQSVIACHIHLTKVNLPQSARKELESFKEFVFELRVRSMEILFVNAGRVNKNLHKQEDWVIEVDDRFGGRTKLPSIFEKNVIDTLRFANETIFKPSLPDEKSILKRVDVQASMKVLAQSLINSFLESLENALINTKEHPEESNKFLLACRNSSRLPSKYLNRILITICNCQFTRDQVFIRLQDEFERLDGVKVDRLFRVCSDKYGKTINEKVERFCRIKCAELTETSKETKSIRMEDLQLDLLIASSTIFLIAPQLVNHLMTTMVDMMQREIDNR